MIVSMVVGGCGLKGLSGRVAVQHERKTKAVFFLSSFFNS